MTKNKLRSHSKTVAMPTFERDSTGLKIEHRFSDAVISDLNHRGHSLQTRRDAVIDAAVRSFSFRRVPLVDNSRGRTFAVAVAAEVKVRERHANQVLYDDQNFLFRGEFDFANDPVPLLKPGWWDGDVLHKFEDRGIVLTELSHNWISRKHAHHVAFFNLILDGHYVEHINNRTNQLKPFTTIFHPSGIEHRDEIGPGGVRIFSIELRDEWLDRMREYGLIPGSFIADHGSELTRLAIQLYREYRNRRCYFSLAIEGLILEMLAEVARSRETEDKRPPCWLSQVVELLNSSFHEKLTVNAIAAAVNVHPVYLSRIFRRFYHQSIGDYQQKLRIQFALRELGKADMDLADIAAAAGFADQSHFTRVFKDLMGMTPGTFREVSGVNKRHPKLRNAITKPNAEDKPGCHHSSES